MSSGESEGPKLGWISRLWRFLRRPSATASLAALLFGGFLGGVVFWGGFHWAVELSNTEAFCVSCHEMRDNPYQDLQKTVHFVNRTGIRAICSDCHVPREWAYKLGRKIVATKDLFFHILGKIDTPEEFEAHRLAMALTVWTSMKDTDSRECRNCHQKVWMDTSSQWGGAARNHDIALKDGKLTCIDCHQGIAHTLPTGFVRPTPEELVKDVRDWLIKAEALEAAPK
ncbi:MAG: NapC/NirT family cytochrome c [Bauldia sp.]